MNLDVRVLPQAIDIEEAVLGLCLTTNDYLITAMESSLTKDCFFKPLHQLVFETIRLLYNKRIQVDLLTIAQELKRLNLLEKIGGAAILSEIANKGYGSIDENIKILHQEYLRRSIIKSSEVSIESAYDDSKDPLETLDVFVKSGKELYEHITFGKVDSTDEIFEDVMARINSKVPTGRSTGIKEIDKVIVALEPGLKYTIAGRPGMGKTAFGKTVAMNLIDQGAPGIFFSMEMEKSQVMNNIIAARCQINSKFLRQAGKVSAEEQVKIRKTMKGFDMKKLIIDDNTYATPSYIHKRVKKAIRDFGIEWILVDYTQMGKSDNPKGKNPSERVGEFSQELKNIAKSEHIVVIELAQINRASEKEASKRPMLSDIKDSGTIEASADTVFLLYRPEYYGIHTFNFNGTELNSRGLAEVIVAKQRSGETGSVILEFKPEFTQFLDKPAFSPTTNPYNENVMPF